MISYPALFKLLSDETRLRILMLLKEEPLCVCQLSGILNISQPKISKNLSKMRDLGIVQDTRKEKYVWYSLIEKESFLLSILTEIERTHSATSVFHTDRMHLPEKDVFFSCCSGTILE